MRRRSEVGQQRVKPPSEGRKKPAPQQGALRIPHDPINEQVVIAAAIADKRVADKLLPMLLPDVFHGRGHADAWEALREIQRRGLSYDPATVAQLSNGDVDTEYLEQLVRDRPAAPPNLSYHVECLLWDHTRIEAVQGPLALLLELVRDPVADPERVRAMAGQLRDAFSGHGTSRYLRSSRQLVREQSRVLTQRREGHAVWPYGIDALDLYGEEEDHEDAGMPRMIPGAAPGKVTLATGVSGSGKTTIVASMAVAFANMGRRVCYAAWEQGEGMTLELCATLSLGLDRTHIMTGRFDAQTQQSLEDEMDRLGEYLKFFRLPFGRTRGEKNANDRALDLVQAVIADSNADAFIADLMRRAFKETNPDDEEQALFRLQAMAEEQRVHHLWLHQQRFKDVETRPDKRPTREGIKGSGAWVEVPDTILGFYRPHLHKNVPDDKLEVLVLKQRYGKWPQAVEFDWDPRLGTISSGRSIDYQRPGEQDELDGFMSEAVANPNKPKFGRGRGRRS